MKEQVLHTCCRIVTRGIEHQGDVDVLQPHCMPNPVLLQGLTINNRQLQ